MLIGGSSSIRLTHRLRLALELEGLRTERDVPGRGLSRLQLAGPTRLDDLPDPQMSGESFRGRKLLS